MFKTQEKYRYQSIYAEYCVHCQHEQTDNCDVSLYKKQE